MLKSSQSVETAAQKRRVSPRRYLSWEVNVKSAKFIIESLLACISLLLIFSHGGVMQDFNLEIGLGFEDYIYFAVLILCVIYLQRLMIRVIFPLHVLSADQEKKLLEQGSKYYNKSFFKGAIALGYLLVAWDILKFIADTHLRKTGASAFIGPPTNYLPMALVFMFIGVASKARGMILYLCQK
jgi:hypothetical protein